jgi:ribosome-associated heat shock protein Hsp15
VNSETGLRLDVWLWRARLFRTRALSTDHVKRKGVRLSRSGQTRRTDKPATVVSVGDIVTFGRGPHIQTLQILALGDRRGPAEEAQALYKLLENE